MSDDSDYQRMARLIMNSGKKPQTEPLSSNESHFNELTPAQDESLTLIVEEASEVNVAIAKIQRHGLFSWNPFDPKKVANVTALNEEVGDLLATLRIAEVQGLLNWGSVIAARDRKLQTIPRWLHHAKVWKEGQHE